MMYFELLIVLSPAISSFYSVTIWVHCPYWPYNVELAWKDVNKGEIKHFGSMDGAQYQIVL